MVGQMAYETLIVEKRESVMTICFNRQTQMNAVSPRLTEELLDALLASDRDQETRALIITGAGEAFCAGLDFGEAVGRIDEGRPMLSSPEEMVPGQNGVAWIPWIMRQMKKPIIAAINGMALGAGFSIALACDIRIASDRAKIGAAFARIGLTPEFGSTYTLPRLVGMGKACELIFTGDIIDAEESKRIGLVNEVVPAAELDKYTQTMAKKITQFSVLPIQMAKRALYAGMDADFASQLQFETLALGMCAQKEDHVEALRAFLEKRKPVFKDH
jgi:2-(1,2-epoxy-1,2-dihydrophenyl)acetyl-CoA isomerase